MVKRHGFRRIGPYPRNISRALAGREIGGRSNSRMHINNAVRRRNARAIGRARSVVPLRRRAQRARRRVYNAGVLARRWNTPAQYRTSTGSTFRP